MQNKFNTKKQVQPIWSFARKVTRKFFLVVFAFVFFLQQVQAFSFLSNSVSQGKPSSVACTVNKPFSTHVSLVHQQKAALTSVEMEVAEDDDKQDAEVEFYPSLENKNGSEELAYDCILRSRFLQLVSSRQQQTEVDFFVLYHSWKKHIA